MMMTLNNYAIQDIRRNQPYSGVSMVWGSLMAMGLKVTRERVRHMLRSIDPLGRVLRCFPGASYKAPAILCSWPKFFVAYR